MKLCIDKENRMSFPLSELAGPNWQSLIDQLYSKLKVEMQGADGFARRAKVAREAQRKSDIRTAVSKFRGMNDLTQLDESINQLADTFLDINFVLNICCCVVHLL